MDRIIKFRIWDGKLMHHEADGYSADADILCGVWEGLISMGNKVMQFTGLLDKNGVDIYSSDVVRFHAFYFNGNFDNDYEAIGQINYSYDCSYGIGVIKVEHGSIDQEWFNFSDTSHFEEPCIEVIGNIHSNPELLKLTGD